MPRASADASRNNGSVTAQSSSSLQPSITRSATAEIGGHIQLEDHTKPVEPEDDDLADLPSDSSSAPTRTATNIDPVSRTATHGSLRETIARRKYRKYQEERTLSKSHSRDASEVIDQQPQQDTPAGQEENKWGRNRVDRGRARVGDFVRGKKAGAVAGHAREDMAIDILYENQRGAFFCGIPRFSSASLLQVDPPAWLDGHFKPSAVNITNAQVPDPSWSWDWRTWYVDMSHDVDEEGWEYSFWFFKGCSWHGTHPWFHSFVRRRRWLRKRVRRHEEKKQVDEAHALNPDYFTIHTKGARSMMSEDAASEGRRSKDLRASTRLSSSGWGAKSWEDQQDEDIEDIPSLMLALRKATIDREKIHYVKKFVDQGGDELHYFADEIPHIMSSLVFQSSRRHLLSFLTYKLDMANEGSETKDSADDTEETMAKRKVDNLRKAMEAADEQCKQLEYWSDVRDVVRQGHTANAASKDKGWGPEWEGVDASGPDPDAVDDDGESDEDEEDTNKRNKGKGRALESEDIAPPSAWVDGADEREANGKQPSDEATKPDKRAEGPPIRANGLEPVQPEQFID